jgi:hypothetical protein
MSLAHGLGQRAGDSGVDSDHGGPLDRELHRDGAQLALIGSQWRSRDRPRVAI